MKPIGDPVFNAAASTARAVWRARALQNASSTSDLRGEGRHQTQHEPPRPYQEAPLRMRHSGTEGPVPFRHTSPQERPRLTAAFTAQLLGQILPDPERRPSAGRFYARETMPLTRGFDTRL
jgi:hypothetical protein